MQRSKLWNCSYCEGDLMWFRCWRCGSWGLKIRHVCKPCWKDNIREINKNIDKRIKLSQNKYDLAMELINLDAKDMGWTTTKTNNGYAIDFHNERYGGPFYFKKFLYSDYYNFFIT